MFAVFEVLLGGLLALTHPNPVCWVSPRKWSDGVWLWRKGCWEGEKTGSPGLPLKAVAPAGQKARNTPDPVLCLTTIRVAGGAKAMEKQQLVGNKRAAWANVAMGRKSNPLREPLKTWHIAAVSVGLSAFC